MLLAQIASEDRAALEALYRRHSGWITARLQHRCGDTELVDTAVQDTFKHPLKALGQAVMGIKTDGEMAPEISLDRQRPAQFVFSRHVDQKLTEIQENKARAKQPTAA